MFSYNARTGNLMYHDKQIVYFEKYNGMTLFYIKVRGSKHYLVQCQLRELAKTVKYFIDKHGCDFGKDVNVLASDLNRYLWA